MAPTPHLAPRLYIATRKGLLTAERKPGAGSAVTPWVLTGASFLGDEVSTILPDPRDGNLYAALRLGHYGVKLHRSTDRGTTWTECATPGYPPRPAAADTRRRRARQGDPDESPWTLLQIWSLEAGGPDEPGVLWAGDLPGGLHRSDDGGESWELCRGLWDRPERTEWFGGGYKHPGLHSICVDPRDARRLKVAVSCGGIWATDDGGESWRLSAHGMHAPYMPPRLRDEPNVQDPHRLVQCLSEPEVFWCQHHSGLYRSTDGAVTWQEIEDAPPSSFGFAMAVHPRDPDVAWRVPATSDACRLPVDGRVVVPRTRDGGASWTLLSEGLPRRHAYHLTLRHALEVDTTGESPTGDRLALASNIGGLWITEDGGECWHEISRDLPPINAVRFG